MIKDGTKKCRYFDIDIKKYNEALIIRANVLKEEYSEDIIFNDNIESLIDDD